MPEMDGEVLYQRIAETWPQLASRVVFVTAQVPSPNFAMLFGDATVPILRKPFKPNQLRRLVERMLTETP